MGPHHPWAHSHHQQALRVPQPWLWCRGGAALSITPLVWGVGAEDPWGAFGKSILHFTGVGSLLSPSAPGPGHQDTWGQGKGLSNPPG